MTKTRVLTLILLIGVCFTSCKKNPEKVGYNLQPNNISVKFDGSQDVTASTFTVPYLSTKMLGYAFLGNINDPIFGISNFGFYTQMSLSQSSLNWGENAVADSLVLNLCYNGYYGDTLQPLTLKIFEITEDMYADSTYHSNMTLQCETQELANMTFQPRPLTALDTIADRGVLRIPMDNSLAAKFIANGSFETNDDFKEFFKGLHIQCDMNETAGAACFFNLTHSYTYMRIYYHNDSDTLSYDIDITSSDVRFNHYSHDFTAASNPIVFNDTTNNPKLYLQGTAGTRVWIKFPNLQKWADSLNTNIAINEAKLILTGNVTDTAMYAPPTQLVVAAAKFDADTTYVIIPDQLVGTEYYGGTYNKNDGTVWFRITEYIQNIIKNGIYATNYDGLFIYVNQGSTMPNRWVFDGPQGDDPVRLEIVYSLIND